MSVAPELDRLAAPLLGFLKILLDRAIAEGQLTHKSQYAGSPLALLAQARLRL
jgi:hypothetical protein